MAEEKNSSVKKMVIIFAAVGVVIAVAVVAAAGLSRRKQAVPGALAKVQLKQEMLSFTFQRLPDIYQGLVRLNDQILLIDKELERLKEIEAEFPRQKAIINAERSNWTRVQRSLFTALSRIEKAVEKIYVSHLVNTDKGIALIKKENKPLSESVQKALTTAEPHTKRLKVEKKKTFIDRIKEKLS